MLDRITLDPSIDLLDAEGRTREMEPGADGGWPGKRTSRVLACGELHGDHRAGRRATAPPTTSIPPSEKGEGGPSGPPPQRSTVQTH